MCGKMITTIVPAVTSIMFHNYHFSSVVRALKIYSLRNFQVYNTVSLTIIPVLYTRSPELIHLQTRSLYTLTYVSSFTPTPVPGNYYLDSISMSVAFSDSTYK